MGLPFSLFLCLDSKIIHFREFLVLKWKILSHFNSDFTSLFFPFSQRYVKSHGVFTQVFHFKPEEIEGFFILGWATKNSGKLV